MQLSDPLSGGGAAPGSRPVVHGCLADPTLSRVPSLSIVIPVGRVDAWFLAQLDAVRVQRTARVVEVIVAANRVVSAVTEVVRSVAWRARWAVRVVDASAVVGPSHARNVGWRAASHQVVLFCDADDLVHPDWAECMAEAVDAHGACGGRLDYARLNPPSLVGRSASSSTGLPMKFRHLPFTPTCSFGVRRDLLIACDGFDETLQCGEDVDLCWRLAALGVRVVFVEGAVVHYRLRTSLRGAFVQAMRYGVDDAQLLRRHRTSGARWGAHDTVRELGACAKAVARAPFGRRASMTAALRLGSAAGRLLGSVRHRIYAL